MERNRTPQRIDVVGIARRMKELQDEANMEAARIKEKYKHVLESYQHAGDEMDRQLNEFNAKWRLLLADYNKEVRALQKRYKEAGKAVRAEYSTPLADADSSQE